MKRKQTLFLLALALVLLLGGAYVLYGQLSPGTAPDQLQSLAEQTPQPSQEVAEETPGPDPVQAPDFTAYDLEGNAAKLSDYFGKPLVLNFWASWCGPCQGEMPDFHTAYEELGEEVQFLMVNMTGGRETLESASAFIQEQGYTFPVLYDTGGEAAVAYSVYSLPTTYFLDANGNAIAQATGAIDAETLQTGIDMIYEK